MNNQTSIFSWHQQQLANPQATFFLLSRHNIDSIYQYVPTAESHYKITHFLQTAQNKQKDVYFLTGEPEWALDADATEVIQFIKWMLQYKPLVTGVVLDIEPHTLKEFKHDSKKVMQSFVRGLKKTYQFAQAHNIKVIVCLPYYLDTLGFKSELETIIYAASDAVAIMNYYRNKEIEHIETEATISQQFQKPLQTIYELQPPGKHGLTDQNTYYNKGLQAVYQNYETLKAVYPKQHIRLSFHEFRYFKELAERTSK